MSDNSENNNNALDIDWKRVEKDGLTFNHLRDVSSFSSLQLMMRRRFVVMFFLPLLSVLFLLLSHEMTATVYLQSLSVCSLMSVDVFRLVLGDDGDGLVFSLLLSCCLKLPDERMNKKGKKMRLVKPCSEGSILEENEFVT